MSCIRKEGRVGYPHEFILADLVVSLHRTPQSGTVPLTGRRGQALVAEADLVAPVQVGPGWAVVCAGLGTVLPEGKRSIVGVARSCVVVAGSSKWA